VKFSIFIKICIFFLGLLGGLIIRFHELHFIVTLFIIVLTIIIAGLLEYISELRNNIKDLTSLYILDLVEYEEKLNKVEDCINRSEETISRIKEHRNEL